MTLFTNLISNLGQNDVNIGVVRVIQEFMT